MADSVLKINIDGSPLNTVERRKKAKLVAEEMAVILNHPSFNERILKMKYHGERSKWKDAPLEGILIHIRAAAEVLDPEVDYELDLIVDDYYSPFNTVGKTYPDVKYILCNTKFFDSYPTKLVGSNFLHEWGHKLGFDHDFNWTYERDFSICYQLNLIYEAVWEEVYGTGSGTQPHEDDLVQVCYRPWWKLGFKHCYWKPANAAQVTV